MRRTTFISIAAVLVLGLLGATVAAADWDTGVAAFQAKNYAEAIKQFTELVEQQEDQYQNHMMLGLSYLRSKNAADAATSLKRALELKPGDAQTTVSLAQALMESGKYRDCVQVLSNVGALPEKMQSSAYQVKSRCNAQGGGDPTADLAKLAQIKPNDAEAQYAYGAAALQAEQTDAAVKALAKAVSLDADAKYRKTYVQALKRQARLTQGANKVNIYKTAVPHAQAVSQSEGSFDNVLSLGEVQMGAKMYNEAVTTFQKAASLKASDWLPQFYIGQAYTAAGRFSDATGPLENALRLASASDKPKVHNQLGFVYEKLKDYDRASDAYTRGGNAGAAQRAQENKSIAEENAEAERHNQEIERIKSEQDRLREEMEALPGAEPPL